MYWPPFSGGTEIFYHMVSVAQAYERGVMEGLTPVESECDDQSIPSPEAYWYNCWHPYTLRVLWLESYWFWALDADRNAVFRPFQQRFCSDEAISKQNGVPFECWRHIPLFKLTKLRKYKDGALISILRFSDTYRTNRLVQSSGYFWSSRTFQLWPILPI